MLLNLVDPMLMFDVKIPIFVRTSPVFFIVTTPIVDGKVRLNPYLLIVDLVEILL